MTQPLKEITDRSPLRIRKATVSNATEVRILLNDYYREVGVIQRDSPKTIQSFLNHPDLGLWIAYVGETPAGVVLRPLPGLAASGECKRLYVCAPFRRRGIAEALLDVLEDYARGCSLLWMYLDSKDDLQAAIALYQRRGYAPCDPYNDNPQATVFLRKSLQSQL